MYSERRRWLLGSVLGIILIFSGSARAAEPMRDVDGVVLAWGADATFELCASPTRPDADVVAAWGGALLWWSAGGLTRPIALNTNPATCDLDAMDGRVAVVWIEEESAWPAGFGPSDATVGFTTHTYAVTEGVGVLLDADVALNAGRFLFSPRGQASGSFDLGVVVAHEMGHALGLGHPCGEAEGALPSCFDLPVDRSDAIVSALMYPSQSVGEHALALGVDDQASLLARFPDGLGEPSQTTLCIDGDRVSLTSATPTLSRWAVVAPGVEVEWAPDGALDAPWGQNAAAWIEREDGVIDFVALESVEACEAPMEPVADVVEAPMEVERSVMEVADDAAEASMDPSIPTRDGEGICACSVTASRSRGGAWAWLFAFAWWLRRPRRSKHQRKRKNG